MNSDETPAASYRLQFNRDFRFEDARALVPYLSRLGISRVYSSPILRARPDSTHGYDVVDPATLNPNLGDEHDFREFVAALHAYGMGLVLDIVPNHMAACSENSYWRHVLTYGPASPYARWFDIDWRLPDPELWGRVAVPVLGEPLVRAVDEGKIALAWQDGRFVVRYYEHLFPLDPATVPQVCRVGLADLESDLEAGHPLIAELREVLAGLQNLPRRAERMRRRLSMPIDEAEHLLARLAQLLANSPRMLQWAERTAARFTQGDEGRKRLTKLLGAQSYRLVHWRRAARVLNYRRFFDINDLISLRQEDPEVFRATHEAVERWVTDGLIDTVRIDHVDGLRDPLGYLQRLAGMLEEHTLNHRRPEIIVEKILSRDERLRPRWPVAGTTGYDFLNEAEAVFVSAEGFREIEENYRRLLGRPLDFEKVAEWGKRRVLRADLSAFVGRLAELLSRLADRDPQRSYLRKRDFVYAVREVVVGLPVYRTYIDNRQTAVEGDDRRYLEAALSAARRSGRAAPEALGLIEEVLLLADHLQRPEDEQHERLNFIQRFQQLTGPAAAKGIEDTALYAYVPLASLNEVGGEPTVDLKRAVEAFHRRGAERARRHLRSMLCVTSHDTKRSADVRSRLDVLSELPKIWDAYVRRWHEMNRPLHRRTSGGGAPDIATEYLFYQSLVGIWPMSPESRVESREREGAAVNMSGSGSGSGLSTLDSGLAHPSSGPPQAGSNSPPATDQLAELRERLEEYMLKAVREAKTRTSWVDASPDYEDAVTGFVQAALRDDENEPNAFLADVGTFVARIARPGFWNALARTLLQLTAPGSPDIYQGDELWNFSLVDPDNRRPVDYRLRGRLLGELVERFETSAGPQPDFLRELIETPEDGRIKLHVVRCALHARRQYPSLFAAGDYRPLEIHGPHRDHLIGFLRSAGDQAAAVLVPRFTTALLKNPTDAPLGPDVWQETQVRLGQEWRGRSWFSMFTRETLAPQADPVALPVSSVLRLLPVALLISSE